MLLFFCYLYGVDKIKVLNRTATEMLRICSASNQDENAPAAGSDKNSALSCSGVTHLTGWCA